MRSLPNDVSNFSKFSHDLFGLGGRDPVCASLRDEIRDAVSHRRDRLHRAGDDVAGDEDEERDFDEKKVGDDGHHLAILFYFMNRKCVFSNVLSFRLLEESFARTDFAPIF